MFWESGWFKYLKNLLIGLGAAFIIIGALFKILHWPYANEILTYAMIGEAIIFAIQGILPPAKEYKWERAYPALMDKSLKVKAFKSGKTAKAVKGASGPSLTSKLDSALAANQIDDNVINSLGVHIKTLGSNIGKLTSVTDSVASTEEYAKNAKEAAAALSEVKNAYSNAAAVAVDLAGATEGTKQYHEQINRITQNLAQLNTVYELELQDTNNHLKALNKFYNNLTQAVNSLNDSVADAEAYKSNMATLNTNLTHLNTVYGRMINAMAGSK